MLGLREIAARARVYPAKAVALDSERKRRPISVGHPHETLKRSIGKHEAAAARAFVSAIRGAKISEAAVEASIAQGAPTPTLEHEIKDAFEKFISTFSKTREAMAHPAVDSLAREVERAARKKATLFNSEPAKTRLAATYAKRDKRLIVDLTKEQRKATYLALTRGAVTARSASEVARAVRNSVGMTEQMANRLANYEGQLFANGYQGGRFTRASERFQGQLINQRSRTIARTEMSWAHNQAQLATMKEAEQQLDLTLEKEWFTADDEVTCEICSELNGERAPLDGTFSSGDDSPPAHPNCRCSVTYDTPEDKPTAAPDEEGPLPPEEPPEPPVEERVLFEEIPGSDFGQVSQGALAEIRACTTEKQLNAWAEENLHIPSVTLRGDMPVLREMVEGTAKVQARFWQAESPLFSMTAGRLPERLVGQADRFTRGITFNSKWVDREPVEFRAFCRIDARQGFHPKNCNTPGYYSVHETAHHIHYSALGWTSPLKGVSSGTLEKLDKWAAKWFKAAENHLFSPTGEPVAEYAMYNQKEFLAEYLASYLQHDVGYVFKDEFMAELDKIVKEIAAQAKRAAMRGRP